VVAGCYCSPVVIYADEKWAWSDVRKLSVQEHDVYAEMRQNGHRSLDEVKMAVIEHNSDLTIIAKQPRTHRHLN
jgi:uncharacterized membrane protein YcaP (DUF421 family)